MQAGAIGTAALGAAVGATKLVPHVAGAPAAAGVKAREEAGTIRKAQPASVPSSWDYTADVVVVGQGGAGCSAAITAHDAGANVIILDKAPTADSGNSGVCGGLSWYPVLSTLGGSLQDFITTVKMFHWGTVTDDELIAAYCSGVANLPTWFSSLGGKTNFVQNLSYGCCIPRSITTGFVSPSFQSTANWTNYLVFVTSTGAQGGGVDIMVFLQGQVASRKIPVLQSTPAEKLIQDPNSKEVIGVQAVDWKGDTLNIKANKGVILACGGFENNKEMAGNFEPWSHSNVAHLSFWGTPYNTGDGITMAQSVGAKLWHMNNKEWTGSGYGCKAACDELGFGFSCSKSASSNVCFIVNRYGQRFMNEHIYSSHTAQLLPTEQLLELQGLQSGVAPFDPRYANLPTILSPGVTTVTTDYVDYPNTPFYLIFDSQLMTAGALASGSWGGAHTALHATPHYTWSSDNSVELAKGWMVSAPDPTTLGNNIVSYDYFGRVVGMNAANLAKTVTNFNSYAASGVDLDFGRPAASMGALNKPPYYAMELCIGRLNTNGGPEHDKYGRTMDVYNNPIPRLYSIGELGSMFGYLYYGGGNFPETLVMGQYAGAHAASLPNYTQVPT